jgi:nicotinamidase/pyrazinamidase
MSNAIEKDVERKRALGIIDAINAFRSKKTGGELPVTDGEKVGRPIGRLQREGGYAYIFAGCDRHPKDMFNTAHMNPGKTPYVDTVLDEDGEPAVVYPEHAVTDTWGAAFLYGVREDLIESVFPKGTKLRKDSYSACGNELLVPTLKAHGITDIDVVGLVFRICVGKTAIDLAKAGFKVRVVVDATRDLPIPEFQSVIDEMESLKIELVTVDQVIAENLSAKALALYRKGQPLRAKRLYEKAISLRESLDPERKNPATADAYLSMVWVHFDLARKRKKEYSQQLEQAIYWYEKAIVVWQHAGDQVILANNLTNLSALCCRAGKIDLAVERARQGLEIAETFDDPTGDKRLAAWNHYAGYLIIAFRLDEAEAVLTRGIDIIGRTNPASSHLMDTLATLHEARAEQLRQQSQELCPGER